MDSIAANPKPLISVENVTFSYSHLPVLDEISFPISGGDFLAILGPNGSGKTTLIKIILGLLKPQKGKVFIMGKPLEEFRDWQRIGYVPQKATHIDPYFPASVREVVAMALLPRKKFSGWMTHKEEQAVQTALRLVDMENHRHTPIGKLSGGLQQRAFIARAIVNQPHLLFLDEPTTGVDAETQERFYETLAHLNKKNGITIVLVTHDIGIINRHITQVACLNQRLVYHGTHAEFCRSETFKDMLGRGNHLISHQH
jgi:zinc transport system ATP-binding protein